MDDRRKSVDRSAVEQNVELDQIRLTVGVGLVVKGRIPLCPTLEGVKEVNNDFGQRDAIHHLHPFRRDVIHLHHFAAPVLA